MQIQGYQRSKSVNWGTSKGRQTASAAFIGTIHKMPQEKQFSVWFTIESHNLAFVAKL